jgi:hypothetical protein
VRIRRRRPEADAEQLRVARDVERAERRARRKEEATLTVVGAAVVAHAPAHEHAHFGEGLLAGRKRRAGGGFDEANRRTDFVERGEFAFGDARVAVERVGPVRRHAHAHRLVIAFLGIDQLRAADVLEDRLVGVLLAAVGEVVPSALESPGRGELGARELLLFGGREIDARRAAELQRDVQAVRIVVARLGPVGDAFGEVDAVAGLVDRAVELRRSVDVVADLLEDVAVTRRVAAGAGHADRDREVETAIRVAKAHVAQADADAPDAVPGQIVTRDRNGARGGVVEGCVGYCHLESPLGKNVLPQPPLRRTGVNAPSGQTTATSASPASAPVAA